MKNILVVMLCLVGLSACVASSGGDGLTVGKVQKDVKIGMSGGDVVRALGNPNIVTTDANGYEVWTYDRMHAEVSTVTGQSLWSIIIPHTYSTSKTSQKTLTIVIYFDAQKHVRDLAYHSSSF